ncbi:SusC/RagA family TonB-linked outer membrane protein [Niabella aurantiaca]|uniref:SusC/RagA family TonB-linked outer membrane protein n=1 Tax=Niabella aurantiaca TaxID=379900 RepID=UPI0003A56AD4|nr:TonB-dependent receptor [Niabella aurantiaca]
MRQFLILLMFLGGFAPVFGQGAKTIRGKVTNTAGEPVVGVTVMQGGKTTLTNNSGTYEINADPDGELSFTHVAYEPRNEKINNRSRVDITLTDANKSLDDVVVIGYGTAKRRDLTGAVSSINGDELAKVPVQNVAQALQGRLAGVQVSMPDGTPGADPSVTLRGGTSISQSNEPLYVVDGVPQPDGVGFLDPTDIETIDVLKDGAANIYGSRGANGVINITTKKIKAGKLKLTYDNYVGFKEITRTIPMLDAYQYTLLEYEKSVGNVVDETAFERRYGSFDSLEYRYGGKGVNWQDVVFGDPVMSQYHKVGLNGGSAETRFNFFFSRNNDEGVMKNSGSVKNVAKLGINHNAGKNVKVAATVNYSDQTVTGLGTQGITGSNGQYNGLQNIFRYRPTLGLLSNDEEFIELDEDPELEGTAQGNIYQNPVTAAESQLRERRRKLFNANATLDYNIVEHLSYRGVVAFKDGNTKNKRFEGSKSAYARRDGGPSGSISQSNEFGWNYNNALTYSNRFHEKHKLDVTLGQEQQYDYSESFGVNARQFPFVNLGWDALDMASLSDIPTSYAEDNMMISFFGRANYGYDDRYLFTAIMRADGSSKFAPQNKWGYFPTFLASWKIINEKFLKGNTALSDLRLRASWGNSGNNRVPNYLSSQVFVNGNYPLNDNNTGTAYQNTLPNPDLKWETNVKANLGLDVGLFKQRVTLTAEYYDNRSKDLLYNTAISGTAGYTNQLRNIGATSSKGFELTVVSSNIKNKDFTWNTNFNITFPKTKVLSLNDGVSSIYAQSFASANDYLLQVGLPLGNMYGWVYDGLYTVDDFNYNPNTTNANARYTLKNGVPVDANFSVQPGYLKLKDISGPNGEPDGIINDLDRTIIGNAQPKFFGGLNNTFSYHGFDLTVFINWVYGNDIYNANKLFMSSLVNDYNNAFAYQADRWMSINAAGQRVTDPAELMALNKGKTIPVYDGSGAGNGRARLYDKMIEDGSFLRLNNISLGYSLPKQLIKRAKLSNARIYVTAYNLYVASKYTGYDPEVSVVNRGGLTPGVDFGAYPRGKSFLAGINLAF